MNGEIILFDETVSPDRIENLIFGYDPSAMFDEELQDIKGARTQTHQFFIINKAPRSRIEIKFAKLKIHTRQMSPILSKGNRK